MNNIPFWLKITFKGRLNRWRYFLLSLFPTCFFIAFSLLLDNDDHDELLARNVLSFLLFFFAVYLLFYVLSLEVRRLHDRNNSAWWILLCFFPLINLGLTIYLLFFKGTPGPNKYGPDPLEHPNYSDYLRALNKNTADK